MADNFKLESLSVQGLLAIQSSSLAELKRRKVIRTSNKPTGDLAEFLFCKAFHWVMSGNSQSGFDAQCQRGMKYQIKSRQLNGGKGSRQLSAIRSMDKNQFDYLAAILFNQDYSVYRAAIIPREVVLATNPSYSHHVNAHKFILRDSVWSLEGVQDVTFKISETFRNL